MKAELRSQRWQKYGGAEKSGKTHFFARLILLPSFRWASHRVAVCRSDVRAVLEPFLPFRGNSVIVNSPGHLISSLACRAEAAAAKAGQTMINLVKHALFGQDNNQIQFKCFIVNDLQSKQPAGQSNPVKVNQTCFMPVRPALLNSYFIIHT